MIVYSALFHPACISLDEGNDNLPMHWILRTDSMHYDTTDIEALDRQASDFIVEDAEKIRIPLLFKKTKITVDLVKSAEKNACGQRQIVLEAQFVLKHTVSRQTFSLGNDQLNDAQNCRLIHLRLIYISSIRCNESG